MRGAKWALALALAAGGPAHAGEPVASTRMLPTANGHGMQVFDAAENAVVQFLERPTLTLRENPDNPDGDGVRRRDLAYDTYFGLRAGATSVWLGKRAPDEVGYVDESNVIRSAVTVGALETESFYWAPFGYEGNALVMALRVRNGGATPADVQAFTVHNFKLGAAGDPDHPGDAGESISWDAARGDARETGPGGGTMIVRPLGGADLATCDAGAWSAVASGADVPVAHACDGTDRVALLGRSLGSIPPGEARTWGVALLFTDGDPAPARAAWDAFADGRAAGDLLAGALAEWEAWRTPAPAGLTAAERRVWRQSEAVLRMGQVREPVSTAPLRVNHGMILASLAPGQWHIGWVRDATYAAVALARAGHVDEAAAAVRFFLDAEAGRYPSFVGGVPYRVSTARYFGNGVEEADYSGHPTRNIELDGWGLALWAARAVADAGGGDAWLDETTRAGDAIYDALRNGVAEALAANIEDRGVLIADASIWEVHWGNRQHFLYTTAAAARGLCDMAALARRAGRDGDRARYAELSARLVEGMRAHFTDEQGALAGSIEKLASATSYRDGATVEALNWDLVPPDDAIAGATLAGLAYLATPAGGYRRVEGSADPYDRDEWVFVDLRAADALRRSGDAARADQLVAWVTAQARANHDLVPELYNTDADAGAIGRYAGAAPMVGYGAGVYQLALLARAGGPAPADCGTEEPTSPGDAGPGDGDAGGAGAASDSVDGVTACGCAGAGDGGASASALVAILGALFLAAARAGSPRWGRSPRSRARPRVRAHGKKGRHEPCTPGFPRPCRFSSVAAGCHSRSACGSSPPAS